MWKSGWIGEKATKSFVNAYSTLGIGQLVYYQHHGATHAVGTDQGKRQEGGSGQGTSWRRDREEARDRESKDWEVRDREPQDWGPKRARGRGGRGGGRGRWYKKGPF